MTLHDALSLFVAGVAAVGVLLVLIGAGWVLLRSGVVKGLKEAAEGWEARADLLAANLADCHSDSTLAASLAADQAAVVAEQHRLEIGEVRAELATARERIAVLEAATDLTPLRDSLMEHDNQALARHDAILAALQRIAPEAA